MQLFKRCLVAYVSKSGTCIFSLFLSSKQKDQEWMRILYDLCLSFPIGKKKALPNIPLTDFHLHCIRFFPYDIYYTSPLLSHIPHIITRYLITQSGITSSCRGKLDMKHCLFYGHCCNFAQLPFMQRSYTCNVLHVIAVSPQGCYILFMNGGQCSRFVFLKGISPKQTLKKYFLASI